MKYIYVFLLLSFFLTKVDSELNSEKIVLFCKEIFIFQYFSKCMFLLVWFLVCIVSNIISKFSIWFSGISCVRICYYKCLWMCDSESISFSTHIFFQEFVRPVFLCESEAGLLVQNADKSSLATTVQQKSSQDTRMRQPDRGNKTRPRENNLARKFRFASNYTSSSGRSPKGKGHQ